MKFKEEQLVAWAQGPGATETQKCENAESVVRNAMQRHPRLREMDLTVFRQGSYRARTNIPRESDVDICVRHNSNWFSTYQQGVTATNLGYGAANLTYADFKNLVGEAIRQYLGANAVTRGNKAFDVHENTYRVDADIVAAYALRDHYLYNGQIYYRSGVAFDPDNGPRIYNWPEQNYENGVAKNDRCQRSYKRVVRILKQVCSAMKDDKISEADGIGSFLIECLCYNAPDSCFTNSNFSTDLACVLDWLWDNTLISTGATLKEVNEIKLLFQPGQPWTRDEIHAFVGATIRYVFA